MEPVSIYNKDGFHFIKKANNAFSLTFEMKNKNIVLSKVIDFNLIKLIYDLNGDIYEKVELQQINETEAVMTMLVKHLFEDLGLPQRFTYVHIAKYVETNKILFVSRSIYSERPSNMPPESEQMPLKEMTCECNIINPHHLEFNCKILFEDTMRIPPFAEKMVGLIVFKIFSRVKQFIENVII